MMNHLRIMHPAGKSGFSLVEVIIALLLASAIIAVLVRSVAVARSLTYANALRVGAFGVCKAKLEEVRGMEYSQLDPTNFVVETGLRFLHLSGRDRLPIACTRSVALNAQTNPVRTDVQVTVQWQYRDTPFQEQVIGTVYPK